MNLKKFTLPFITSPSHLYKTLAYQLILPTESLISPISPSP